MTVTTFDNIIALLRNISGGYTAYTRYVRVTTDTKQALQAWDRIGGFSANTGVLLDFLDDYTVNLVEYAKWTPIEADDLIAKTIQDVLKNHRETVINIVEWVRKGHNPSVQEFSALATDIHLSSDTEHGAEYGSPMDVLYIISIIYHVLMFLKPRTIPAPDTDTKPTVEPPNTETKRPLRDFLRKLFNRPLLA
jgi:hypothetical protein